LAVAALAAHHFYCAVESAMERFAVAFEGTPERCDKWHQDLLVQMALDLPAVRQPVLTVAGVRALRPVLQVRHFLRHAYAVALDPEQMLEVAHQVADARATALPEIARFVDGLTDAARLV
jgi:hypothetical protein